MRFEHVGFVDSLCGTEAFVSLAEFAQVMLDSALTLYDMDSKRNMLDCNSIELKKIKELISKFQKVKNGY